MLTRAHSALDAHRDSELHKNGNYTNARQSYPSFTITCVHRLEKQLDALSPCLLTTTQPEKDTACTVHAQRGSFERGEKVAIRRRSEVHEICVVSVSLRLRWIQKNH